MHVMVVSHCSCIQLCLSKLTMARPLQLGWIYNVLTLAVNGIVEEH